MKFLDNITDEDIVDIDIPAGVPLVYELDEKLEKVRHYYLRHSSSVSDSHPAEEDVAPHD